MLGPVCFCLALLIAIPTNQAQNAQDLVSGTCDQTLYKDYCKSVLGLASAKDLPSLTKFALNAASTKAGEISNKIKTLSGSTKDTSALKFLNDCTTNYISAADQVKQSAAAVDAKKYSDVNTWVTAAMSDSQSCEDGFKEKNGVTSPLTAENTQFTQLCSIILTMSNLLNKA